MNSPTAELVTAGTRGGSSASLDAAQYRHVIGHFMSGVAVVTTVEDGQYHGMTASAVASLSLDPPMLIVCMNLDAPTQRAITRTRRFGLNVLEQDQGALAERFATPLPDKFAGVGHHVGRAGQPLLDGALARLECSVVEDVVGGTHRVLLARVDAADVASGSPLAYYRGRFGRFEMAQDAEALEVIRELVLRRAVPVGDALSVDELHAAVDVPRSSVQYALTRLVSEGLVMRDSARGWLQVPLDVQTSDQAFEAKLILDRGAARLAIERASDQALDELVSLAEAIPVLDGSTDPRAVQAYVQANATFHERMISMSCNTALVDAYRRLRLPGMMSQVHAQSDADSRRLIHDHVRIAQAMRARDLATVQRLVEDHHTRGKHAHRQAIEEAGGQL